MKHSRIIFAIAILCCFSLTTLTSQGQSGKPFLEGGILVTAGGYSTSGQGSIEQSIGQVAYTITTLNDFTLEQGVLHAFYIETPTTGKDPQKPTTPVESQSISCSIYPNPCANRLNIDLSNSDETIHYRVIASTGAQFLEGSFVGSHFILPVNSLPSGLYIIMLETLDGMKVSKRFIKE